MLGGQIRAGSWSAKILRKMRVGCRITHGKRLLALGKEISLIILLKYMRRMTVSGCIHLQIEKREVD